MEVMAFRTDTPAVRDGDSIGNHDGADMAAAQDLQRGINGRHGYDPISCVSQNRIADGSQHPFCGDRKDCRAHKFCPSTRIYCLSRLIACKYSPARGGKQAKKGLSFVKAWKSPSH